MSTKLPLSTDPKIFGEAMLIEAVKSLLPAVPYVECSPNMTVTVLDGPRRLVSVSGVTYTHKDYEKPVDVTVVRLTRQMKRVHALKMGDLMNITFHVPPFS